MAADNQFDLDDWTQDRLRAAAPPSNWEPSAEIAWARFQSRSNTSRRIYRRVGIMAAACALLLMSLAPLFREAIIETFRPTRREARLGPEAIIPQHLRKLAPALSLPDSNGRLVELSDYKGRVVALNFWATWCQACDIEIPWLIEFERQRGPDGLVVIGISMDEPGWARVRKYMEERGMKYPVTLAGPTTASQYGVGAMPMTILVDRQGRIARTVIGLIDKPSFAADLKGLLEEKAD